MYQTPSVRWAGTFPKWTTAFAMGVVHALRMTMYSKPLVVTSANDGKHSPNSKHYSDDAFDCRTFDLTESQRDKLVAEMRRILDPLGYDIIDREDPGHQNHTHVEYDPKPGEAVVRTK